MAYFCNVISDHHLALPHNFVVVPLYLLKEEDKSLLNDMLSENQTSLDLKVE